MTPPPWYFTDSAVNCYVFARRWPDSDASLRRAERELIGMIPDASFRQRDPYGRELWKSPKRTGGALRWVIDPRPGTTRIDHRPRVIWVGYGRPPPNVWSGPMPPMPFSDLVARMPVAAQERIQHAIKRRTELEATAAEVRLLLSADQLAAWNAAAQYAGQPLEQWIVETVERALRAVVK